MDSLVTRFHEAVARLDALIAATPSPLDTSREAVQRRAAERMERVTVFLDFLGSPAAKIPKIHVGGTSGKGSTTTALASILNAAGYRTGVHTSPYLQSASEKLQWNNHLIEADRFVRLVDTLFEKLEEFPHRAGMTYGEAWIALVMLFLEDIEADVAIVEVGAGGRFDLTNVIESELAIITSIGIDHVSTLGDTMEAIAWHKAGIIKSKQLALSAVKDPTARAPITDEAAKTGAFLYEIDLDAEISDVVMTEIRTDWVEATTGDQWTIGMAGRFQARNGQTARSAARILSDHGWSISRQAIQDGLAWARIPGRAELMPHRPRIMLDGAHNAQKVSALAADLPDLLPRATEANRIVILGTLEAKQVDDIVSSVLPHADVLIATTPQVLAKESKTAAALAEAARDGGFVNPIIVEPDPFEAVEQALSIADADRGDAILVTGSLYLVGNIRDRFYPRDQVISQHTSWPRVSDHDEELLRNFGQTCATGNNVSVEVTWGSS